MDKTLKKELLFLSLGEIAVAVLTVFGFLVFQLIFKEKDIFDYTVITGALLGGVAVIVNFLILSFSVSRAVNSFIDERGDKELTEEEAEAFAAQHKSKVQLAITRSYIIRTALTFGILILAFVLDRFCPIVNPIATAIPLFSYKPVLYLVQFIKSKGGKV